MSQEDIPTKVHKWWPVVTAVLMLSGFISTAVGYYAKNETRAMVKAELIEPLKDFSEQTDALQDQMKSIEKNQIATDAQMRLILELIQKNNNLLNQQNKTIEDLKK
jgi:polyhydroxyalkanoate synthesis regulator protein